MAVFQDKNGNCMFEFTFHKQRHRHYCKTKNRQIAEQMEREYRRTLEHSQFNLVDFKKKQVLFKDAVADYMARMQPKWKPDTREMHRMSLIHVGKFFGPMVLNAIKADDIQRYQAFRQTQLTKRGTPPSNRTINTEVTLVRQVLVDKQLWYKMREGKRLMLKQRVDVGKALQEQQVVNLLNACQTLPSRALYPMVMMAIFTGVRWSELRHLKWGQIDFERRLIVVGESKTDAGEGRQIPLDPLAESLIKDWCSKNKFAALPHHYVFPSEKYSNSVFISTNFEKPYNSLWYSWNLARKAAGVECRWHDLRHTCASILASKGASKATIKAVLGWFSDKPLDIYIHSYQQEQQQAMSSVGNFLGRVVSQLGSGQETIQ